MKLFKCIVMLILILITIRTGYLALLYKVSTSTGAFLICLGITLFVASDGGLKKIKLNHCYLNYAIIIINLQIFD